MQNKLYFLLAAMLIMASSHAQPVLYNLGTTTVETETIFTSPQLPWELKYGPGDSLWMTTRTGQVYRIHTSNGGSTLLLNHSTSVWQQNESGMLGMAFHPNFAANPYVYIVYTYDAGGGNTRERLSRFTYSGNALINETIIFDGGMILAYQIHNGSRLVMLPDNTLLMTTGDANNTALAQNPSALNGKVLRLTLTGSIPADNPDPASYVYSRGHRNPQGLVLHPNGKVYSTEHGPSNNDEFQIIEAGRNYGWPDVQGFCDNDFSGGEINYCINNNIKEPLLSWNVAPGTTWAPSDLIWYDHPSIPDFQNSFLIAFLKTNKIVRVRMDPTGEVVTSQNDFFPFAWGRLRDITAAPNGEIFIANNSAPFRIIRVRATGVVPVNAAPLQFTCLDNGNIKLHWRTFSEDNLLHFRLDRSTDGVNFSVQQYVPSGSGGQSATTQEYTATDVHSGEEVIWYRLVAEFLDGRTQILPVLTVRCSSRGGFVLSPNPAKNFLRIQSPVSEPYVITFSDAMGRKVHRSTGVGDLLINTNRWKPGVYFYRIAGERSGLLQSNRVVIAP